MTIADFIKLYGTTTTSLILRKIAEGVPGNDGIIMREVANALQLALEDYTSKRDAARGD